MSKNATNIDIADDRTKRRVGWSWLKLPGQSAKYCRSDPYEVAKELRENIARRKRGLSIGRD